MFVGTQALYLGQKYQIPVIYTYHTRYEDYLHYIPFFREEQAGMWRKKLIRFAKDTVVPGYMKWFTNKCDLIFAPTPGMQNGSGKTVRRFHGSAATGLDDSFYIEDEEKDKNDPQTISWGREKRTFILFRLKAGGRKKSDISPEWNPVFEREAAIFVSCAASG